jgi:GDPmannose 4,6-dehydratase
MWMILQQREPDDYVIATGVTTSVREFVRLAFLQVGIVIDFQGQGVTERGYVAEVRSKEFNVECGQVVVVVDPSYFRPAEVDLLIGDSTKARRHLAWTPDYELQDIITEMVEADLQYFRKSRSTQWEPI